MSTPTATPPRINLPAPRPPQAPDAALTTGTRIVGSAFNALDLEKLRQWYETVLGFRVVQVYEQAGAVFEYLLTPAGGGGVLALITTGQRPRAGRRAARPGRDHAGGGAGPRLHGAGPGRQHHRALHAASGQGLTRGPHQRPRPRPRSLDRHHQRLT